METTLCAKPEHSAMPKHHHRPDIEAEIRRLTAERDEARDAACRLEELVASLLVCCKRKV